MGNDDYRYTDFCEEEAAGLDAAVNVSVIGYDRNYCVGAIKWYAKDHGFCFFPLGGAVIPARCLKEILAFMNERIDEYADAVMREENSNGQ